MTVQIFNLPAPKRKEASTRKETKLGFYQEFEVHTYPERNGNTDSVIAKKMAKHFLDVKKAMKDYKKGNSITLESFLKRYGAKK